MSPDGRALQPQHNASRTGGHGQDASRDRAWLLCEVAPKLDAYSLVEIAKATGISLAACSQFPRRNPRAAPSPLAGICRALGKRSLRTERGGRLMIGFARIIFVCAALFVAFGGK